MTIREVGKFPATEADVGKWAVPKPWRSDNFCGRPVMITKVAKSRVYYRDTTRKFIDRELKNWKFELDGLEQFMNGGSLLYVCETEAEALTLYTMSEQQGDEIRASEKMIREKYKKYVAEMC